MSLTIKPEHVKFVVENGDGTSTLTMQNGMRHVMPSKAASQIAEVLNNEVKATENKLEAFSRIPDSLRIAAEKTLRIKN